MIEVSNLSKHYGNFSAVRDVSFTVEGDNVLGFLGPNGAGKTTIMKILTGYHFPSGGTARVDGISVEDDPVEVKKRIGYLPENVPLYGDLNPEEYLRFIAESRLIPRDEIPGRITKALETCGLKNMERRRIENLSKGYKQRLGLAQAIIHDPPILILDEPTSGLDPNQIIEIRSLIRELGKSKTVILSTHILQEVEAVCTRVLILHEGKIAAQGRAEEIAGTLKGGDSWELTLKGDSAPGITAKLTRLGVRGGRPEALEDGTVRLTIHGGDAAEPLDGEKLFDWAVAEKLKILSMARRTLSLEDIFVKLTNEEEGNP